MKKLKVIKFIVFIIIIAGLFFFSPKYIDGQSLLTFKDSVGGTHPVITLYDWEVKRGQIIDSLEALFGKFPGDPNLPPFGCHIPALPPFNTKIIDSLKTDFYTRYNIRFTVAKNEDVTAYLYIPFKKEKGEEKFPAMLALQPTGILGKKIVDGQGPLPNRAYGKELAERGYVVIAPDFPSFGDQSNYNFKADRYESGVMKGIFNHIRCVDFLQARTDVDPERIGVIGHSLGGHSAMYVAAFDTRLKVIVSSCGWTLYSYFNDYTTEIQNKFGSRLWGEAQERYTPLALTKYHLELCEMPFDFDELGATLAPRYFFSNSPINDANFNVEGVRKGMANISEVYHFLKAGDHLQVRYPIAIHDFPRNIRIEAYQFIDKVLMHTPTPNQQVIE